MMRGLASPASLAWLQFWQVAVVAVVVGFVALGTCRHRPRLAHSLWLLVLIKALVPPLWASPLGVFSLALAEVPAPAVVRGGTSDRGAREPATDAPPASGLAPARPGDTVASRVARRTIGDRIPLIAASAWLAGSIVACVAASAKLKAWRRLLGRSASPAGRELTSTAAEVARTLRVRRGVKILTSSEFIGPLVYGVLRPTVVLPEAVLNQGSTEQVRLVIAHELVHVRRGDIYSGLMQTVVQLLWWFHPSVWWASREASRERERCCDQEVVAALGCSPATYARTLLWVLELKGRSTRRIKWFGVGHSQVTARRLEFIMKDAGSVRGSSTFLARVAFVAGAACFLPGMGIPAARRAGGEADSPTATRQDASRDAETALITVAGRALDEAGEPVAGATIYLESTNGVETKLGRTMSDAQGDYEFRDARLPVRSTDGMPAGGTFQIYGTASGKGFTWHGMRFYILDRRKGRPDDLANENRFYEGDPIKMNLTFGPPASLRGKVVDQDGKPVVGAKISLHNADWLDVRGKEEHQNFREFWCITAAPPEARSAETGPDGRFEIPRLPVEAGFWVFIEHADYARQSLHYATTNRPAAQIDYPHISYLATQPKVEIGDLTIRCIATRGLAVRVVRGEGGDPAPDVKVHLGQGADGTNAYGVTDAQGKVNLKLPPGEYPVRLDPERGGVYVRTSAHVRVEDQPRDQAAEFRVDLGCILILEVVDADTGKGIAGVDFLREDTLAGRRIWSILQASTTYVEQAKTDEEGRFRAIVKPGQARVHINYIPKELGYEVPTEEMSPDMRPGETTRVRFKVRKRAEDK